MTKAIDNKKILTYLTELNHERTRRREDAIRAMVQVGLLSDVFDVKNYEYDQEGKTDFKSYERKSVLSKEDIIERLNAKISYYEISRNDNWDTGISIKYFIGAIKMFDEELANELIELADHHNIKEVE